MARNKDVLLLLLDVGPSMHSVLPEVEKVCSLLVQKKMIYRKDDQVGIVLFGTKDTDNKLTTEVGGYQHVVVLKSPKVVDGDIVEALQKLPRGTTNGDFLDAVIVGMDMLIQKIGRVKKRNKSLCLITNAQCPIKEPYGGTKEGQVTTIAKKLTAWGMKMESIVFRGKLSQDANKRIMDENDRLLNIFSKETSTRLLYVENPISLFGALRTRNINLVTVFRGDLEFGPKLSIKVMVYKKSAEETFPTLKIYSDKAPPNYRYATHEVKIDYEYKSSEDPDKVVPPDQGIKGYPYGPQIIPISSVDWDAFKFKPEKGVKLLGFTDSSNVVRHHYMKDAYVFLPEPGNTRAMLAVSALARAMKEMDKVAILRCVWRQGLANVLIGVLTPNLSDKENIPDSFYFNVLPFAEDVRKFQFPTFCNFRASQQPNKQQLQAAANLIKTLDLAPHGRQEVLLPDFTPNPVLERFYRFLELKSKNPDVEVPPVDDTLKKISEPDADLLLQSKSVINTFCRSFKPKGNPSRKSRRLLGGKRSFTNDEEVKENFTDEPANLIENASVKVEKIWDVTPAQDLEALISRRDSPDWVVKTINEIKNKVFDVVEDSHKGDDFPKALEWLVVLRKICILEQKPKQFNDFFKHLWNFCQEKSLHSFCQYLASKDLTLVSKTEAVESDVTDEEARSFFVKSEPIVE